jgi:predicted MFS family arabinose efflux permease
LLMRNDERGVGRKVLIIASSLLLIIMSFTGFINYMTLASNYNHALVNTYAVAGNELVKQIEYALNYGKPMDNYYGMQDILVQLESFIPELEQVAIVSPEGEILYDRKGFVRDFHLHATLGEAAKFQQGVVAENLSWQFHQSKAYLFIGIVHHPSNQSTANHVASLMMVFPEDIFLRLNSPYAKQVGAWLAGIALSAMVLLLIIFFRGKLFNKETYTKKKLFLTFVMVIGGAQLCYTCINYFLLKDSYTDMAYKSKDFIHTIVTRNIESIYDKGLTLENITGLDKYFDSIQESLPQIAEIGITSAEFHSQLPVNLVRVTVSEAYLQEQISQALLDMLTVLIISVLFMTELTLLAVFIIMAGGPIGATAKNMGFNAGHGLVRALIFLISLCAYMSLTFVPIVMETLYQPIPGLTKDVVLGLPLSAEMLGGILAIFLAGRAMKKSGWRLIFYSGILLLMVGNILAGLSTNGLLFIVARGIAGLGLGCILIAIRSLVVSLPDANVGIAEFSAGSIAGVNCGLIVGGMLADQIGYAAVFYIAASLALGPIIIVRRFMTEYEIGEKKRENLSTGAKSARFILNKKVFLFLICIFVPYFISGAFLDYFFPLFASVQGLSQSDISRGFLLNGLFIIYLGPVLAGYASRKLGGVKGMITATTIVICALATFVVFGTMPAALVTIALLGIADSFGVSLKTTHFLNLPGIKDLEINQGIGYFSGLVNLSRMAGPIIYGLALSLGTKMGMGLISLGMLTLLLVFIFFAGFRPAHSKIGN